MVLIEGALNFVYVPVYDINMELRAIARVPSGSSTYNVSQMANQHLSKNVRSWGTITDAEAETLIEMGCCPLLNFNTENNLEDLEPFQGYRDQNGLPIKWRNR